MDFIVEIVVEALLNALLAFPGAFIRWIIHRGNTPYMTLLQDDLMYNASYVFMLLV